MRQSILIIDREIKMNQQLSSYISQVGFSFLGAVDINQGLKIISEHQPDVIVIDLDLPMYEAFDFCKTLRYKEGNWTPIILMSEKDEEFDLVLGLELGADDYIRKPVRPKELVARIKSILRRQSIVWPEPVINNELNIIKNPSNIVNGDIKINPDNYTVYVKGKLVQLSMKEYEILLYLCKHKGKPISREELLAFVGENQLIAEHRIIDVFISRIRDKIEPCRSKPFFIKTVRNVGYMIVDLGEAVYS